MLKIWNRHLIHFRKSKFNRKVFFEYTKRFFTER